MERGTTLLEERGAPLAGVVARPRCGSQQFEVIAVFGGAVGVEADLVGRERQRGESGDLARPVERVVEGADSVHGPRGVQPLTRVRLGRQEHAARRGRAEFAAEAVDGPLVDHEPEAGGGNPDDALRCGDAQVADRCQLGTGAERRAVDRGDDGGRQRDEAVQHLGEGRVERPFFHARQIRPGAERRRLTAQHDRSGVGEVALGVEEFEEGGVIDRVAPFGSVQRDGPHAVTDVGALRNPYHARRL